MLNKRYQDLNKALIVVILLGVTLLGVFLFIKLYESVNDNAQAGLNCPGGYTVSGNSCIRTVSRVCPNGGTLQAGGNCTLTQYVGYGPAAGGLPQQNVTITSITSGWQLVSGTIVNNWLGGGAGGPVLLSDSLFNNSNGVFQASPSAGYYGTSTAATVGTLPIGRSDNFFYSNCSSSVNPDIYQTDFMAANFGAYDRLCTFGGSYNSNLFTLDIRNASNIVTSDCRSAIGGGLNQFHLAGGWQTGFSSNNCGVGTRVGDVSLNILNNRYFLMRHCVRNIGSGITPAFNDYYQLVATSNSTTGLPACNTIPTGGSTFTSVSGNNVDRIADFYDANQSQSGYFSYVIQRASVCPAAPNGGTITPTSATTCTESISGSSFTIDNVTQIGIGNCNNQNVVLNQTFNCTFPLSGAPAGVPYILPPQGIYGGILNTAGNTSTFLGNGSLCSISGSSLICNNIPTSGASLGSKPIYLHQPGIRYYENRGNINVISNTITITNANVGNCTPSPSSRNIGTLINCTFPLSGALTGQSYLVPVPTNASIATATGVSNQCTASGSTLTCNSIPTVDGTEGLRDILLSVGGGASVDKGDVTLVSYQTTNSNISNCTPNPSSRFIGESFDCTFNLSGQPAGTIYNIPANTTASVSTATGTSNQCTASGTVLTCANIPTANGSSGLRDILLSVGGSASVDKGDITLSNYTITNANVGDCTLSANPILIGQNVNCTFPLTGAPAGVGYVVPSGTVASIATATGSSSPCTVSGSTLTCNNIPSINGTAGNRAVNLSVGGTSGVQKATISLNSYTLTDINVADCTPTPSSRNIGETVTCTFNLSGAPAGATYFVPANTTASISTASGNSSQCTVSGSVLTCANIPTVGGTAGLRDILLSVGGVAGVDKGDITLINYQITQENIGNCLTASINKYIGETFTCTFNLSGQPAGTIYNVPENTFANVTSVSETSSQCTVSGLVLTCANIPTAGGTEGLRSINLSVGGGVANSKGDIILEKYTITSINIANCSTTPTSRNIGETFNCTFALSGAPAGAIYYLPANTTASVSTATGNSSECTVSGSVLTCNNIPTIGGSSGTRNINLSIGGGSAVSKGSITLINFIITPSNIGDCSPDPTSRFIGETFNCTFALSGAPSGTQYNVPNNTTASVSTATGTSSQCTVSGSTLTCNSIPTIGGAAGLRNINLSIGGAAGVDKGDIILSTYTITSSNVGNCTPNPTSRFIGETFNCTFALSGAPSGVSYTIPANTNASTSTATGISNQCTASGSTLTCNNIPTVGGSTGSRDINLSIGGGAGVDKGDIVLSAYTLSAVNVANCNPSPSTRFIGETFNCTFALSGAPSGATYFVPANTTASVTTASGNSNQCTASGNTLTCTAIPTSNGTVGVRDILLSINLVTGVDKGDITLAAFNLTAGNVGSCLPNPSTRFIGEKFSCTFGLSGAPAGAQYFVPANTRASVNTATGTSSQCTVSNNTLTCSDIPTIGGTVGLRDINLSVGGAGLVDRGDITLDDFVINISNVGDCTPIPSLVNIGSTVNCQFALSGAPADATYFLPEGLTVASITTAIGVSNECSVSGTNLLCNNLPSIGGTVGSQDIILSIPENTPTDKGNITLTAYTLTINDVSNCSPSPDSVFIGELVDCTFVLSGQPEGTFYAVPDGTIASINSATGNSDACTSEGALLICNNLPTNGGTAGVQNILLSIGGSNPTNRGTVTLNTYFINGSNVGNCIPSVSSLYIGEKYNCSFELSNAPAGAIYNLPSNTTTSTSSATGISDQCSIDNTTLICNNVPTFGGSAGVQNILLSIGGETGVDKGDITLVEYLITSANVQNCSPSPSTYFIGETFNCTFALTGAPQNVNYSVSPNTTAYVNTATGTSSECTVNNVTFVLTCNNIPTAGGSAGNRDINLSIGGDAGVDKGDVTLTAYTITAGNVGLCVPNPSTITLGQTVNCTFALTGAPTGASYIVPSGTVASISTATGTSNQCTASGSILTCNNIPSIGGTIGTRDILLSIGGGSGVDKGNIVLESFTLVNSSVGLCTPSSNPAIIGQTVNCTFALSGAPAGGNYTVPANTTASITSASGNSDQCTSFESILTCNNIPTAGGSAGLRDINLSIGGAGLVDKGDITLQDFLLAASNVSNCSPSQSTIYIGETFNCTFTLTGAPSGVNYTVPSNTKASVSSSSGVSDDCTVSGSTLTCNNIPTAGGSAGLRDINLSIGGDAGVDKGDITLAEFIITSTNVANCSPSPSTYFIGETFNCSFELSGAPSGVNYTVPNNTTASVSTATGTSSQCSASGSTLTCNNIPTAGGSAGLRDINISIGGDAGVDKGDVTLANYVITNSDVGNCTPNPTSRFIGETFSCTFALSGAPSGAVYTVPSNTTASVSTATGTSSQCSASGSTLTCNNIPTIGGNAGSRDINLSIGGGSEVDKGDITLVEYLIINSNINDCLPNPDSINIGLTFNCTFPLTGGPTGATYFVPANTTAFVVTATGQSNTCTVSGDNLICNNIPTVGGSAGVQDIEVKLGGIQNYPRGEITLTQYFITSSNVGNCSPSPSTIYIGVLVNCSFELTGATSGTTYFAPSNTTASISTATGTSSECTVSVTTLTCNNIPSTGGSAGSREINLSIGGGSVVDKGDITLEEYILTIENVGNCTSAPSSVTAGTSITCTFPLSGGPTGANYIVPSNTVASVSTATGTSSQCTSSGAVLTCTNIPTTGATGGARDILLSVGGGSATDKGDISISTFVITASNVGSCTPSPTSRYIGELFTCTFALSGSGGQAYVVPANTVASVSTATGVSDQCTSSGSTLTCANIPTIGGTPGGRGINLSVGGAANVGRGTITLNNYTLTASNVGDCIPSGPVFRGASFNCTFPLSGAPAGVVNYSTPSNTRASVSTASGTSALCTSSGAVLTCNTIPTTSSTVGVRDINLSVGGAGGVDKGDVTIVNYEITDANVGNCNPSAVFINQTFNCTFALSGAPGGVSYTLPAGTTNAKISTADGVSSACTISGSTLTCNNIPTSGGTAGVNDILLSIGGGTRVDKGDITINLYFITSTNVGNCTPNPNPQYFNRTTNCTFNLSGGPNGVNYNVPANTFAYFSTNETQLSNQCTVSGSVLTCNNIPTEGATAGARDIMLSIGGEEGIDKGNITIDLFVLSINNVGSCTPNPSNIFLGETLATCSFPLSNVPSGALISVPNNTVAQINGATGVSNQCTTSENNLICNNIPTDGATTGGKSINISIGGGAFNSRGNITLSSFVISQSNVGNCTPSVNPIIITLTFDCTFALSGAPTGVTTYGLPGGSNFASVTTASGSSSSCSISGSILTCFSIPTNGGSAGLRDINLVLGGGTPTDKGDITLTNFIIGPSNIGDCVATPSTLNIGQTTNCVFALSGAPQNASYVLPSGTNTASISTASGSGSCSISGSNLNCNNIPSAGGSAGVQNILLVLGGEAGIDKGDITLQQFIVQDNNIGSCTVNPSTRLIGELIDCTFALSGAATNVEYFVPEGTVAKISTTTGVSSPCYVTGSTLYCNAIPTLGGTVGTRTINIIINSVTGNNKGNVTLAIYTMVQGDVGNCTANPPTIFVGQTTTCTFPLSGQTPGTYTVPSNTTASIEGASGVSNQCTSAFSTLTCTNIPSVGTQVGERDINLSIGGGAGVTKGSITITDLIITDSNVGDCAPSENPIFIGQSINCTFALSGASEGSEYILPDNTRASIAGASGTSDICTVSGATLICNNLPSTSSTPGIKNIILAIGGANPNIKGTLTLEQYIITTTNIANCTPTSTNIYIGENINCTFALSGAPTGALYFVETGTTAAISTATGTSSQCTVNGASLICNNIPTINATEGVRDINLKIGDDDPVDKGDVTISRFVITTDNIGVCNPTPNIVYLVETALCNFNLTGAPTGAIYFLPDGITKARITTVTNTSEDCYVSASTLICEQIPSIGGSIGARDILISLAGATEVNKGNITLAAYIITASNVGNCIPNPSTIQAGFPVTSCTFPLTGATTGVNYVSPIGTVASISTATGTSSQCTISGSNLICNNIPTTNVTVGLRDINLSIGGGSLIDRGDITVIGRLSISVSETATLPALVVRNFDSVVCTTINNLRVFDNRIGSIGWSVSATSTNFTSATSSNIIPVSNRLQFRPKTITALQGGTTTSGITAGNNYFITNTNDPASIMTAAPQSGLGEFRMNPEICFTIPAFTPADSYITEIQFTVV
jgi:hypothetical protein